MRSRLVLNVGFLLICSYFVWSQQTGTEAPPAQTPTASYTQCIDCHTKTNPLVVSEWKQSKHAGVNVGCTDCHGNEHTSGADVAKVKIARPEICARCHQSQVDQYRKGKHSFALAAMKTMPNAHWRSISETLGQSACTDCHEIGSPHVNNELRYEKFKGIDGEARQWGAAACSSCHSRHSFSLDEARQPQTCRRCHSGGDNAQWEMYAGSKHGILFDLKQRHLVPADAAVPTCQTCHMPGGDHEVRTAWGYRGVRLPLPSDKKVAADRNDILRALNITSPDDQPTLLMDSMKSSDVMRFTDEAWQKERDKMVTVCTQCHSEAYAKQRLGDGDAIIDDSDRLLAEAIRVVMGLYKDGYLAPPDEKRVYPWLTRFDEPPTAIEQKLESMYSEHRMAAFQGIFHNNLAYGLGNGFGKMGRDLVEIKEMEAEIRRRPKPVRKKPATKASPQEPSPLGTATLPADQPETKK
jgi:hydroxylamine dehydrogenase